MQGLARQESEGKNGPCIFKKETSLAERHLCQAAAGQKAEPRGGGALEQ